MAGRKQGEGVVSYLLAQASAHRIPLRDESIQCVVTSPPYWGLRSYSGEQAFVWGGEQHAHEWGDSARSGGGKQDAEGKRWQHTGGGVSGHGASPSSTCACGAWYGALGLEPTPELYVEHMVEVFREVRRVLRKDGTLWLNLGDSYLAQQGSGFNGNKRNEYRANNNPVKRPPGLKPKDLAGIPWMVAFALRADGWYLRSDIIWSKANPMPESVTDRPTKSHEYLFLLAKSPRYFYDADAIREPAEYGRREEAASWHDKADSGVASVRVKGSTRGGDPSTGRNARTVWNIGFQPEEEVEWTHGLGFCRRCGNLRVAGNGSEPTTVRATGGSRANTSPSLANSERIGSPTNSSSDQSRQGSPSTTSVGTEDASGPTTSSRSRWLSTSTGAQTQPRSTAPNSAASTGTSSLRQTLIRALAETGNAVCVCETESANGVRPASDVWRVATQPYPGAHFATFPEAIPERCIKAGSRAAGRRCDCDEIIATPLGDGGGNDPTLATGRAGFNRERGEAEGTRPITRREQREYAAQMAASPHRAAMAAEAGSAFAHYLRTDASGARPAPQSLIAAWTERGWLLSPTPCDCAEEHGDVILDPFNGSGTTGRVAQRFGRRYVGLDLSREYMGEQALRRIDPLAAAAQDVRTSGEGQQVMAL